MGADTNRLRNSIRTALKLGKGSMCVIQHGVINPKLVYFSRNLMCLNTTGIAYPDPEPNLFSFNSPYACPTCNGLGTVGKVDRGLVFPNPQAEC